MGRGSGSNPGDQEKFDKYANEIDRLINELIHDFHNAKI